MTTIADIPRVAPSTVVELRAALDGLRRRCLADPRVAGAPTAAIILDAGLASGDDVAADILERLARKVEVGRSLRAAYAEGLGTAQSADTVHPSIAEYLAALLVAVGLARGDWKLLNTAVKMEGGILKDGPVTLADPFAGALRRALGEEA